MMMGTTRRRVKSPCGFAGPEKAQAFDKTWSFVLNTRVPTPQ
jgi:hypothetical protein